MTVEFNPGIKLCFEIACPNCSALIVLLAKNTRNETNLKGTVFCHGCQKLFDYLFLPKAGSMNSQYSKQFQETVLQLHEFSFDTISKVKENLTLDIKEHK